MNWIERVVGKKVAWVIPIGYKGGRPLYSVIDYDGNEEDWFLDYDSETGSFYYKREDKKEDLS